jgi:microcystin-dependent protein
MIEIDIGGGTYKRAADLPSQFSTKTVTDDNYTVADNDGYDLIFVDTGDTNRTIWLPTAADNSGRKLQVIKVDSGSGQVFVRAEGSDKVMKGGTEDTWYTLRFKGCKVDIICDGTDWWQLNREEPAGMIRICSTSTLHDGYLECAGQAVPRTTYPALFDAIGEQYGNGDGSTTFNLPDLRGVFIRGYNHGKSSGLYDPDAGSRTDRGDGTTGDNVGTKQDHQIESHRHNMECGYTGSAAQRVHNWTVPFSQYLYTGYTGGNETRPVNVQMMYVIKY